MKTLLAALLLSSAALAHAQSLEQALTAYDEGRNAAAAKGFAALAAKGVPLAQYNLAMMHLRRELPKASDAQAWTLLNRAAAQGSALAEHALGQMIEQGRRGKPVPAQACDWFERAAEHGQADGALDIATCYYLGRGRTQDMGAGPPLVPGSRQGGRRGRPVPRRVDVRDRPGRGGRRAPGALLVRRGGEERRRRGQGQGPGDGRRGERDLTGQRTTFTIGCVVSVR